MIKNNSYLKLNLAFIGTSLFGLLLCSSLVLAAPPTPTAKTPALSPLPSELSSEPAAKVVQDMSTQVIDDEDQAIPDAPGVSDPEMTSSPSKQAPVVSPASKQEPAQAPVVAKEDKESEIESKYIDPRIPRYTLMKPNMALTIAGTLAAFGNRALVPAQGTDTAVGMLVSLEYQPRFIQDYGVLGIGPYLAAYPVSGNSTNSIFALTGLGVQIKYQLRYFRNQPLVPVIAYNAEYLHYRYTAGPQGNIFIHGPTFGLWLLMNILEPSAASSAFLSTGILRTYLVFEYRTLRGSRNGVSISGGSYYGGLRFEF